MQPALLVPLQCCEVPDGTTRIMFSTEEGFGDEDETLSVSF